MKKSLIAILMTAVILLSLMAPLLSTVQAVDPSTYYTTVDGVLDTDYYTLYPYTASSLNVGFSKYGELIGIPAGADQTVQANWVGLEYQGRDPFCPATVIPMTSWINGWYADMEYIDPALSGVKRDRHLWAFAMFSDGFGWGGDWTWAATPGSNPGYGRQTNGVCTTDPLEVLYDGPREFIAQSVTHISDKEGTVTWPVVDVAITLVFNKVKKEVILLKDIKLKIPKMHLWGKLDVQFSNREEYDLGAAAGYDSYAHFYEQVGITSYGPDWHMAKTLLRENVEHQTGTGQTVFTLAPPGGAALATDFMKVWINGVFQDPSTYAVNWAAQTITFSAAVGSVVFPADVEVHYKFVFKEEAEWDGEYDIAQVISSDTDVYFGYGNYVAWTATWPPVSDYTVDGILRYLDPLVVVNEADCMTEPKQSPLIIAEWDFLMDHAVIPQFRCVEVKGITDNRLNYMFKTADDADMGFPHGNVIGEEVQYQLDEVFKPWDLLDAVEKQTKRWVYIRTSPSPLGTSTITLPLTGKGTLVESPWDEYCAFSERVIVGGVLIPRFPYNSVYAMNYYTINFTSGRIDFYKFDFTTMSYITWVIPAGTRIKVLYSTKQYMGVAAAAGMIQVGLCLDDSGSIDPADWTTIKTGVADAIRNSLPHDGSIELTVVQFSSTARVAVAPTVVTGANYEGIATTVGGLIQEGGMTAMAAGLNLTWYEMHTSPNFATAVKQVINVATDGGPNITLDPSPTGDAADDVTWVRTNATTEGLDEIDAEAIGEAPNIGWMQDGLVWPQPGNVAPPYVPGWVEAVPDAEAFAEAMANKFAVILQAKGRYEWIEVGRDSQAVDSVGSALVAEAFDSYKGIDIGIGGVDMLSEVLATQCPAVMSKFAAGTEGMSNYKDTIGRAALVDDWCTYWPVASSNMIGVGGPYANLLAYYANDFTNAFFGLPPYSGTTYMDKITGIPCWNRGWNGTWNVYASGTVWGTGLFSFTAGYAVISTYKDINGTVLFMVWGHHGRDTYYASQWLHGDEARGISPGIIQLQYAPRGLTSIVLQINYGTFDPTHPTFTIVECLGTISETLWRHWILPPYLYEDKGGIHDP